MKLLLMEDKVSTLTAMKRFFEKEGFEVFASKDIKESLNIINKGVDFAVLDLKVPIDTNEGDPTKSENTLSLLRELKEKDVIKNTIVYTASETELTMEMREEIWDLGVKYIFFKDCEGQDEVGIANRLKKMAQNKTLSQKNRSYFKIGSRVKNYQNERMVFFDQKMQEIMEKIEDNIDSNFMLYGPSGSGKGILANHIWKRYSKAKGKKEDDLLPFQVVDCPSLKNDTLSFNDRLNGHLPGSFTNAARRKKGILEIVKGGVLFLDEWADIPYESQVRLLKVIEEKKFVVTGDDEEHPLETEFKLIVATNRDIHKMISEGTFREDLFDRVNMESIKIYIPPLSSRKNDIIDLTDNIIQKLNSRKGSKIKKVDKKVLDIFLQSDWSEGNVRTLHNVINIAHGKATSRNSDSIEREDIELFDSFKEKRYDESYKNTLKQLLDEAEKRFKAGVKDKFMRDVKKDLVREAVIRYKKQSEAAKVVGVSDAYVSEFVSCKN